MFNISGAPCLSASVGHERLSSKSMRLAYRYGPLAAITFTALLAHGAEPLAGTPSLKLSVAPDAVALKAGQHSVKVVYTFTNGTATTMKIKERYAHFECIPPWLTAPVMGPFPTSLDIPARGVVCWSNDAYVEPLMTRQALKDGFWPTGKLVLAQSFSVVANEYGVTDVTAKVTFGLGYPALDLTNFPAGYYDVTALKAFIDDPDERALLMRLLDFAERAPAALSNVLGICPDPRKKIPLFINSFEGVCHYNPNPEPHISMPWWMVGQKGGIGGLFAVYPHELAHYFLMTRFPSPPKWFIEGPASFFGNKVTRALGHEPSAVYQHQKLLGFAQKYIHDHCTYCFDARWPEDTGENDNPDDIHSYGYGYAYQICLELEQLCGEDFFRKVFHHMDKTSLDFTKAPGEHEKNRLLIEAFQSQTRQNLRKFFAEKGFK